MTFSIWQNILLLVVIITSVIFILFSLRNLSRFDELRSYKNPNRWLYIFCILLGLTYLTFLFHALTNEYEHLYLLLSFICLLGAFIIWLVTNYSNRIANELTKATAVEHYHATHDDLTGLPNLTFFNEQLELVLEDAANNDFEVALLIIDLNRFQLINETIGYFGGDILLREISQRIRRSLRKTDLIARLGGDEFAVVINPVVAKGHLHTIANNIADSIKEPLAVDDKPADVGVSIGISIFPSHASNGLELISSASSAMQETKHSGTPISIFDPNISNDTAADIQIIGMLQRAVNDEQLIVLYQPQVRLTDMQLVSVEALMRWNHPSYGLLDPSSFIPYAERAGLIYEINNWLLQEVASVLKHWNEQKIKLPVAINITVKGFLNKDFQRLLTSLLKLSPWMAKVLRIELTETSTIENADEIISSIKEFRKRGLIFILDDYGTRHASLEYLKKLPFDEFKVDRSFMINAVADNDSKAIIQHAREIGDQLKLAITAEGIENKEILELAQEYKFDYGQGYYFSPATSAMTIKNHIEQYGMDASAFLNKNLPT